MPLYNLKTVGEGYRITKFDDDLNVEASYLTSWAECECPQGQRGKTCRHQKMLHLMRDRVDSPWFFDYDQGRWHKGDEPEPELPPMPKGVEVVPIGNPEETARTIASAVGEPWPPEPVEVGSAARDVHLDSAPSGRPKVRRRI